MTVIKAFMITKENWENIYKIMNARRLAVGNCRSIIAFLKKVTERIQRERPGENAWTVGEQLSNF